MADFSLADDASLTSAVVSTLATRWIQFANVLCRACLSASCAVQFTKFAEFRRMLEVVGVSLWARQLKTPYPVSIKWPKKYCADLSWRGNVASQVPVHLYMLRVRLDRPSAKSFFGNKDLRAGRRGR